MNEVVSFSFDPTRKEWKNCSIVNGRFTRETATFVPARLRVEDPWLKRFAKQARHRKPLEGWRREQNVPDVFQVSLSDVRGRGHACRCPCSLYQSKPTTSPIPENEPYSNPYAPQSDIEVDTYFSHFDAIRRETEPIKIEPKGEKEEPTKGGQAVRLLQKTFLTQEKYAEEEKETPRSAWKTSLQKELKGGGLMRTDAEVARHLVRTTARSRRELKRVGGLRPATHTCLGHTLESFLSARGEERPPVPYQISLGAALAKVSKETQEPENDGSRHQEKEKEKESPSTDSKEVDQQSLYQTHSTAVLILYEKEREEEMALYYANTLFKGLAGNLADAAETLKKELLKEQAELEGVYEDNLRKNDLKKPSKWTRLENTVGKVSPFVSAGLLKEVALRAFTPDLIGVATEAYSATFRKFLVTSVVGQSRRKKRTRRAVICVKKNDEHSDTDEPHLAMYYSVHSSFCFHREGIGDKVVRGVGNGIPKPSKEEPAACATPLNFLAKTILFSDYCRLRAAFFIAMKDVQYGELFIAAADFAIGLTESRSEYLRIVDAAEVEEALRERREHMEKSEQLLMLSQTSSEARQAAVVEEPAPLAPASLLGDCQFHFKKAAFLMYRFPRVVALWLQKVRRRRVRRVIQSHVDSRTSGKGFLMVGLLHAVVSYLFPKMPPDAETKMSRDYERKFCQNSPKWVHKYPPALLSEMLCSFEGLKEKRLTALGSAKLTLRELSAIASPGLTVRDETTVKKSFGCALFSAVNRGVMRADDPAIVRSRTIPLRDSANEHVPPCIVDAICGSANLVSWADFIGTVANGHIDNPVGLCAISAVISPREGRGEMVSKTSLAKRKEAMIAHCNRAQFSHATDRAEFLEFCSGGGSSTVSIQLRPNPFTALKEKQSTSRQRVGGGSGATQKRVGVGVTAGGDSGGQNSTDRPPLHTPAPQWV